MGHTHHLPRRLLEPRLERTRMSKRSVYVPVERVGDKAKAITDSGVHELGEYVECGHQWEPGAGDPETNGPHLCRKNPRHVNDITDDDHKCCCGANTWETP